jgi:hypothetical protein
MTVVEDFADSSTCPLGDFGCALARSHADVLTGNACALADAACGVDGVQSYKIAGTFADTLGCSSGSLSGTLANVARSAAEVTAGAAGLGP